jgi:hypothetical protein
MSNSISIGVATAEATMEINVDPVLAFNFIPKLLPGASFVPSPTNEALISPETVSFTTEISPYEEPAIGGISFQQPVNINVGETVSSIVPEILSAYKYKFENFDISNPSNFSEGDIVFFKIGNNNYSSTLEKASVTSLTLGAKHNLFIFMSYDTVSKKLEVMHKGYFEIPDSKITTWSVGSTLYLDSSDKLNIIPTSTSGHWIRSLGFCIPNNVNKKFIWFEPDTTYLKLK